MKFVLILLFVFLPITKVAADWTGKPVIGDLSEKEMRDIEETRRRNWTHSSALRDHIQACSAWGFIQNACKYDLKKRCRDSKEFMKRCKERGITPLKKRK